jgi:Holliday junction resolvasome RuvABC endonuclease subunit
VSAGDAGRLLALDLSTNVGWAFYRDRDSVPSLGTWHAPRFTDRDNYGAIFVAFEDWLLACLREFEPTLLAFEAPILPRNRVFQKQRAIRLSYGLAEITERIAFRRAVRCIECHPSTVKVRLAGHGTARKMHMIAAAERLGFVVETDHEADAIGVALVAFDHVDPPQAEMALR